MKTIYRNRALYFVFFGLFLFVAVIAANFVEPAYAVEPVTPFDVTVTLTLDGGNYSGAPVELRTEDPAVQPEDETVYSPNSEIAAGNQTVYTFSGLGGYTLSGGATTTDTYQVYINDKYVTNVSASANTVEAEFFTVSFDANGGEGSMQSKIMQAGSLVLPKNNYTKTGAYFNGWAQGAPSSGTKWADEATISIDGTTALYATWAERDYGYTLSYHLGNYRLVRSGGSGTMNVETNHTSLQDAINAIEQERSTAAYPNCTLRFNNLTLQNSIALRHGRYALSGELTTSAANGIVISAGARVEIASGATFRKSTLGSSGEVKNLYKIEQGTLVLNGAQSVSPTVTLISSSQSLATIEFGADYSGEKVSLYYLGNGESVKTLVSADAGTSILACTESNKGRFVLSNENNAIGLKWDAGYLKLAEKVSLTYTALDRTGGDVPAVQYVVTGESAIIADEGTMTRRGYDFSKWRLGVGATATYYEAGQSLLMDEAKTLAAIWTPKVFSIVYKLNPNDSHTLGVFGETPPNTHTYATETVISAPSRVGYTFLGFNDGARDIAVAEGRVVLSRTGYLLDITLTANWRLNAPTYTAIDYTGEYDGKAHEAHLNATHENIGVSIMYLWTKDGESVDGQWWSNLEVSQVSDSGTYDCTIRTWDGEGLTNDTTVLGAVTVNITKKSVTVKLKDVTSKIGQATASLEAEIAEGGLAEGDTLRDLGIKYFLELGEKAGEYPIKAIAESVNYEVTFIDGIYTLESNIDITAAIVGGVSGGVAGCSMLTGLILFLIKKRRFLKVVK